MNLKTPKNVLKGAEGFHFKGSNNGVILIHGGGGGSASDMREMGKYIYEATGMSVFAPLLPGYGTTKEDLYKTKVEDWINALKQWLFDFKNEVDKIFLIGHSMGGILALYLACQFPNEVHGVISISTPMKLKGFLLKLVPLFQIFIKYWKTNDIEEFQKISNGIWVGYEKIPLNTLSKIKKLIRITKANLNQLKSPILIIQGNKDQFVPKSSPNFIYNSVSSTDKSIKWFDTTHEILFSKIKNELFSTITEFLKKFI
ncbi:MAG: alpha/beta hydrolase [Candidatus Helarchaeota archaeon]